MHSGSRVRGVRVQGFGFWFHLQSLILHKVWGERLHRSPRRLIVALIITLIVALFIWRVSV